MNITGTISVWYTDGGFDEFDYKAFDLEDIYKSRSDDALKNMALKAIGSNTDKGIALTFFDSNKEFYGIMAHAVKFYSITLDIQRDDDE